MNVINPILPHLMLPTVGRIVHFHLGGSKPLADPGRGRFECAPAKDTYAATVAAVTSDGLFVNLTVSDFYGNTFGRTLIPFVQPGDERPSGAWCEWPPIQNTGRIPTLNTPLTPAELERLNASGGHRTEVSDRVGEFAAGLPPDRGGKQQLCNAVGARAETKLVTDAGKVTQGAGSILGGVTHPLASGAQQLDNDGNGTNRLAFDAPPPTTTEPNAVRIRPDDNPDETPAPTIPQD